MTTARSAVELGRIVRDAREQQGLTQVGLARAASVGRQWLVGLELGDKESAPLDMILRVLAVLDLEVTLVPPLARQHHAPVVDLDAIIAGALGPQP